MPAIRVSHLTREFRTHIKPPGLMASLRGLVHREYKTKIAVNDLSFEIARGEFVGFLGPNGAGKTTTLKILAGVLHPTSGEAELLGHIPWRREPKLQRRFSLVLGQKNQLWWDLPALDSFILNRDIYEIPQAQFDAKVAELSELLDLGELLQTPVRKLSLGERMKCEIAASLLHSPEVLFLDEPTIGLDVVSQARIRAFLRDYNERTGITVLLTSHYMADIQALCKRVLVIDDGRALFDGELKQLAAAYSHRRRIRLTLKAPPDAAALATLQAAAPDVEVDGVAVALLVPDDDVPNLLASLLSALQVDDLSVEDVEIESIIREMFTRPSAPAP